VGRPVLFQLPRRPATVAKKGLCSDLCVPFDRQTFWHSACFFDCPRTFVSIRQRSFCDDLCMSLAPGGGALVPSSGHGDLYPGATQGFERGYDASGHEIFRYERGSDVYVIPAAQYYDWRAQYVPYGTSALSSAMLSALLLSRTYGVHTFPRSTYYSRTSPMVFRPAPSPYYRSTAYTAHYPPRLGSYRGVGPGVGGHYGAPVTTARPVMGLGSPVAARPVVGRPVGGYAPPVAVARPVGGGSGVPPRGTPVATARPISQARPVGGSAYGAGRSPYSGSSGMRPPRGTPVATARPISQARPMSRPMSRPVMSSRPTSRPSSRPSSRPVG